MDNFDRNATEILTKLRLHDRDRKEVITDLVSKRLNKSFESYLRELDECVEYLVDKKLDRYNVGD